MAYTPFLTLNMRNIPPPNLTKNLTLPPISELVNSPVDSSINDPFKESEDELPKAVRIELAHQAWIQENGASKIKDVARCFGVGYSTLRDCINSAISKELANQAMQKLSVAEEEAIRDWLLELAS